MVRNRRISMRPRRGRQPFFGPRRKASPVPSPREIESHLNDGPWDIPDRARIVYACVLNEMARDRREERSRRAAFSRVRGAATADRAPGRSPAGRGGSEAGPHTWSTSRIGFSVEKPGRTTASRRHLHFKYARHRRGRPN